MNANHSSDNVAVLCEKQGLRTKNMQAYLESHNITAAQWYDPLDLDNLDMAVCQGHVGRAIFPELSTLLTGIWTGRITYEQWLRMDVSLDFVNLPDPDPSALTHTIFESWQRWQRRHRHRQAIAGVILSAIIIVTIFLFVMFMR